MYKKGCWLTLTHDIHPLKAGEVWRASSKPSKGDPGTTLSTPYGRIHVPNTILTRVWVERVSSKKKENK